MQGGAPGELRPDLSCERFTLFVRELGVHKLSGVHNVAYGRLEHNFRRLSEGLSTNSYGHREERGARTIVAGQNSSGVALPKRQPKRADFCPISPATIHGTVVLV